MLLPKYIVYVHGGAPEHKYEVTEKSHRELSFIYMPNIEGTYWWLKEPDQWPVF
jgi:hypothetical protein